MLTLRRHTVMLWLHGNPCPLPLPRVRPCVAIACWASFGLPALETGLRGRSSSVFTAALVKHFRDHDLMDVIGVAHLVRLSVLCAVVGDDSNPPWVHFASSNHRSPLLLFKRDTAVEAGMQPFPSVVPLTELFIGRCDVLALLLPPVSASGLPLLGRHVSIVSGSGGTGKSALLRELCRRAHRRSLYPAGIFWLNAANHSTLDTDLRCMASQPPFTSWMPSDGDLSTAEIHATVLRWLATHGGWLLVMDNVENADVVRDYLPLGGMALMGDLVLASCANVEALTRAGGPSASAVELCGLPPDDALAMLVSVQHGAVVTCADALRRLGGNDSPECRAAQWLVGADGMQGLPLSVQLAASCVRVQHGSWVEYAAQFRKQQGHSSTSCPLPWESVEWRLRECVFRDRKVPSIDRVVGDLYGRRLHPQSATGGDCVLDAPLFGRLQCGLQRGDDGRAEAAVVELHPEDTVQLWAAAASVCCSRSGPSGAHESGRGRASVLTVWALSLGVVKMAPGLGLAALQALQLCSLLAPDCISVELLVRAGWCLPATSCLRRFLQGGAGSLSAGSPDEHLPPHAFRRGEALVCLLFRHGLIALQPLQEGTSSCFSVPRLVQSCELESLCNEGTTLPLLLKSVCSAVRILCEGNGHLDATSRQVSNAHGSWIAHQFLCWCVFLGWFDEDLGLCAAQLLQGLAPPGGKRLLVSAARGPTCGFGAGSAWAVFVRLLARFLEGTVPRHALLPPAVGDSRRDTFVVCSRCDAASESLTSRGLTSKSASRELGPSDVFLFTLMCEPIEVPMWLEWSLGEIQSSLRLIFSVQPSVQVMDRSLTILMSFLDGWMTASGRPPPSLLRCCCGIAMAIL